MGLLSKVINTSYVINEEDGVPGEVTITFPPLRAMLRPFEPLSDKGLIPVSKLH